MWPWNAPWIETISRRPLTATAVLIATSTASEPDGEKTTPGQWSPVVAARRGAERRLPTRDQMVVADVDLVDVERVVQRAEDLGVAVPEVEDAAVAVAVEEAPTVVRVPEERALAPPEHDVDAERLERLDLARGTGGRRTLPSSPPDRGTAAWVTSVTAVLPCPPVR